MLIKPQPETQQTSTTTVASLQDQALPSRFFLDQIMTLLLTRQAVIFNNLPKIFFKVI